MNIKSCPKNAGFTLIEILIVVVVLIGFAGGVYYLKFYHKQSRTVKTEDGKVVRYEENEKEVKMTDKDGTMIMGENIKIPADFPKNIPLYPGANITSVNYKDSLGGYTAKSKDDMKNIVQWFKTNTVNQGWKFLMGSEDVLEFTNQDLLGHLVVAKEGTGGSSISFVTYNQKDLPSVTESGSKDATEIAKELKQQTQEVESATGQKTGLEFSEDIPDTPYSPEDSVIDTYPVEDYSEYDIPAE